MADYIDGFVFPIAKDKLGDYQKLADEVARIWVDLGALEYREFRGDDMALEGTLPFPDIVDIADDEVIVFGWVSFESREVRDAVNEKVANDPRMTELMSDTSAGFDPTRMAYGGFSRLIPSSD